LRFSEQTIDSTYLINSANFIAVHQFNYLQKYDVLKDAEQGATLLLNAPFATNDVWNQLPKTIQQTIIKKQLKLYVINAGKVAKETGMGNRINGILQTCFFAISNVIPKEQAIDYIKKGIRKSYGRKGEAIVQKNFAAVDSTLDNLFEIDYSKFTVGDREAEKLNYDSAPGFVQGVLSRIISGEGDELPVSAFPTDGTYPSATTKYEKRAIADAVPVWDPSTCSQCGKCYFVCPHAAIRPKVYSNDALKDAPDFFKHTAPIGKEFFKDQESYTLQVSVDDCTGCNLCYEVCPIESKTEPGHKAINMEPVADHRDVVEAGKPSGMNGGGGHGVVHQQHASRGDEALGQVGGGGRLLHGGHPRRSQPFCLRQMTRTRRLKQTVRGFTRRGRGR